LEIEHELFTDTVFLSGW